MNKNSLLKAIFVSVILGLVFPAAYMLSFTKGVVYEPPLDSRELSQLSLNGQAEIVEKRARLVSGLQVIISNSSHPHFWLEYGKLMIFGFIFAFLASTTVLFWQQRSNPQLNRTRADNARAG